jgi:hypothetical protein
MATRQPQGGSNNDIGQQVSHAGRERNTIGQTESETAYWRKQYQSEPYYSTGESFSDYEPAYRTGIEARSQYEGQRFDEVEDNLRSSWEARNSGSSLGWDKASQACRAAWDHAGQQSMASDRDRQPSKR